MSILPWSDRMSDSLEDLLRDITEQIQIEKKRLEMLVKLKEKKAHEIEIVNTPLNIAVEQVNIFSDIKPSNELKVETPEKTVEMEVNDETNLTVHVDDETVITVVEDEPRELETKTTTVGILYSSQRKKFKNKIIELLSTFKLTGLNYILFTVSDIDTDQGTVEGTLISNGESKVFTVPIPKIIYNLAIHSKLSSRRKLRQLRTSSNLKIINPINLFFQDALYEILTSLPSSNEFLLPNKPLNKSSFNEFIKQYDKVYLLQNRSRNHAQAYTICKNRTNNFVLKNGNSETILDDYDAFFSIEKIIRNKQFNIIKGIETLDMNGFPAEYRVYVQRNNVGKWIVTSTLVKNEFFTKNSIYNHQSKQIYDAFSNVDQSIINKIKNKTSNATSIFTEYLDYFIPNVGSYYFDFLLDKTGHPYLVYVGGFEHSKYLSRSNNEKWDFYLNNIIAYLHYCYREINKTGIDENVD
jgi:hypothetical protein